MKSKTILATAVFSSLELFSCANPCPLDLPQETHIRNVRQLTFGGENAEAYFSFKDDKISFQSTRGDRECDQIYSMDLEGKNLKRVSNGTGRTTCSYYLPDGKKILYASTYLHGPDCPPKPDYSKGYVWAIYDYDIFVSNEDGSDVQCLFRTPGYDAEATISHDGKKIIFTSTRDGDLDLYTMNLDGSDVQRITKEIGYDGGAFFSPDSKKIVYRAHHPTKPEDIQKYQDLLKQNLVRPSVMEIYVANADGSNAKQLTNFGAASFAPFYHPDGKRIIFASNKNDPKGRNFDLFMIRDDGTELEQITFYDGFDSFPMFTRDGKTLIFSSNRFGKERGETNVFLADWRD